MHVLNLFTREQLDPLLEGFDFSGMVDGKASAIGVAADLKSNRQRGLDDPVVKRLFENIWGLFLTNGTLKNLFFAKNLVAPRVVAYSEGDHYDQHVDAAYMDGHRTDLSFTLALSDGYEGGQLELNYGDFTKKVTLSFGQMVVYPTGVLHRVLPVTRGRRLVAVGWIESMIPREEDRKATALVAQEIEKFALLTDNDKDLDQLRFLFQYLKRRFCA